MAFYILLLKDSEDERSAVYQFGPHEDNLGWLRLDKQSGIVDQLVPVRGEQSEAMFVRAAAKIRRLWERGQLPSRTSWAS